MQNIINVIKAEVTERFLRYVKIDTTASETSGESPSSLGQWELAKMLETEMRELGIQEIQLDKFCYLYATIPASPGVTSAPITFCAHLDTSPSESGNKVNPIIHKKYTGADILFPDNPELKLTPTECPELLNFLGDNIITAGGKTLLGADDKAGIAEIMTALSVFQKFPQLKHPELRIAFTPDEEIGEGTKNINLEKLGKTAYTLDGGITGELEDECFNAWGVKINFAGINYHPGMAKNKMVNAITIAARFVATIPEYETPEHTSGREGFFHIQEISGNETAAFVSMIIRDFDEQINHDRIAKLELLKKFFELKYPGLQITINAKNQYRNMREVLSNHSHVTKIAEDAMLKANVTPIKTAIRGGTDGARLSFLGIPTPNLFAGGMLFHSKKEWIPESALTKATEVILHICEIACTKIKA